MLTGAQALQAAPAAAVRLLLIRHGETAWNVAARIQGFRDIGLSARGQRQAVVLAQHLAAQPIDAVYASDLARAIETARPLSIALGCTLRIDAGLKERSFGLFEGSTYAEAQARWPEEYARWQQRQPGYAVPGGESFLETRARVMHSLTRIAAAHAGQTVAVITHGGVLDIIYRAAAAIAWEVPRSHLLPNACINRVEVRLPGPELTVLGWAESTHLDAAAD